METKKKKMDIVTKMSLIGGIGLVLIILVLGIVSLSMNDKPKKEQNGTVETGETGDNNDTNGEKKYVSAIAVVKEIDADNNRLRALNVDTEETFTLIIDGAVDIKDEYGTLLTLGQLDIGDMIETKYEVNSMRPEKVQITGQTWERKEVSNLIVNAENKTIQIGNDLYRYTDAMVTLFLGQPFDFTKLDPVDEVTVKGYKDAVWVISVEKTHGYIKLQNHMKFIGGTLEIGKQTITIAEDTKITVPIGVHSVVISKEGMTSFITEVLVEENQEVVVDIGDVKAEAGMVSFVVTPSDVKLYLNDVLYSDLSKPIPLDFGTYKIRLEKDNYVPLEKEMVVNQAYMSVEFDMDKTPIFLHVDNPVGASLIIDNNDVGVIPLATPIDPGPHTIILRQEGYYSKLQNIQIEDNGKDAYLTFTDLEPIAEETTDTTDTTTPTDDTQSPDTTTP